MLDSDVPGILRAEEVAGDDLASGLQLQWAAQAEFPSVARLVELDCCAIPLTVAGSGGIFAVLAGAVAGLDLGTQRGEVDVSLTGGPSGAAHHSESCLKVFIEIAADLEGQFEIISTVPTGATWFLPEGRLPHVLSLVRAAAGDDRCGGACPVHLVPRTKGKRA